jgi:hypothetical protein
MPRGRHGGIRVIGRVFKIFETFETFETFANRRDRLGECRARILARIGLQRLEAPARGPTTRRWT